MSCYAAWSNPCWLFQLPLGLGVSHDPLLLAPSRYLSLILLPFSSVSQPLNFTLNVTSLDSLSRYVKLQYHSLADVFLVSKITFMAL